MAHEGWGRWGPVDKNTCWRCEPLSFAYFSLRRQRKVGAAPHRGDVWSELTIRGCQRKQKQTANASEIKTKSRMPAQKQPHRPATPKKPETGQNNTKPQTPRCVRADAPPSNDLTPSASALRTKSANDRDSIFFIACPR